MSLWKIAWRSIQQRALASWLTGLSMALGVALVVIVLVLHGLVTRTFSDAAQGYNLLLGKKGGSAQLVMNTVFHLQRPIESIPWSFYEEIKDDKNVEVAVPFCLGDRYQDSRVVGTTSELFEKLSYGSYDDGTPKKYRCQPGGRFFTDGEDDYFTAVVGSIAARKTGLKVGSKFAVTHGLAEEGAHTHDEQFEVVGILEPTNTPNDRAVFINIEGFYLIADHVEGAKEIQQNEKAAEGHGKHVHEKHDADKHGPETDDHKVGDHDDEHKTKDKPTTTAAVQPTGDRHNEHDGHSDEKHADENHPGEKHLADKHDHHDHHGHHHPEPLPESLRKVTSILVLMKDGDDYAGQIKANDLYSKINKGDVAQAVFPIREVRELQDGLIGNARWLLLVLSGLVVLVAGIGVMVSIYNSMSDRRRDIAIMRSLGAGRRTVMAVILLESIMLSLIGGLAGVVLAHGAIGALSSVIVNQTGVTVHMFQFEPIELMLIPGLVLLASLVGFLPAWSAYRTDVAKALSAAP